MSDYAPLTIAGYRHIAGICRREHFCRACGKRILIGQVAYRCAARVSVRWCVACAEETR